VKLRHRHVTLVSPPGLPAAQLRLWVHDQLRRHGEPLRWAITSAAPTAESDSRLLRLEAVWIQ
jgi:hypothetical protein